LNALLRLVLAVDRDLSFCNRLGRRRDASHIALEALHVQRAVSKNEVGGTETIGGDFTLRKQRRGIETEELGVPRSAGQALIKKNISAIGFFGGEHAYDFDAARRDTLGQQRKRKAGEVEVSVDVEQLGEDDND
jgi:hypothetical protein